MNELFKVLWRQRRKYFLLLGSIAIGAVTICTVSAISDIGTKLMDKELDSMGLNGLIVTSSNAQIEESAVQTIESQSFVNHQTPLCYEYCNVDINGEEQKILLWGMDERAYNTVTVTLLHGRLLNSADAGTDYGMVDATFARKLYSRENIIGKKITVTLSGMPVTFEVVGVVDTGGSLTGQLMGNVVPCFLYLSMETMRMYTGKDGYNQLMIDISDSITASEAAERVASCFSPSVQNVQVQNMSDSRDQLSGVLNIFSAVLTALGSISFITSGISTMTVMLQNVREQTKEIGIKKALGASNARICLEYLSQSALLSFFGNLIGCLLTAAIILSGCALLGLGSDISLNVFWLPAVPGTVIGIIFGIYPAMKAAKCHPAQAIAEL